MIWQLLVVLVVVILVAVMLPVLPYTVRTYSTTATVVVVMRVLCTAIFSIKHVLCSRHAPTPPPSPTLKCQEAERGGGHDFASI